MNKKQKEYIKNNLPYFTKIPRKSRYKNVIKDRAWSILSDYVRVRDYILYKKCISCGKEARSYNDFQAGHWISMGGHGAYIGFHHLNVHGQCPMCNLNGGMEAGGQYQVSLTERYGGEILDSLQREKHFTCKADDWWFLEKTEDIYRMFQRLKDDNPGHNFPEYLGV